MKTAVIIGSTGLVGKELVDLLINDHRYSKLVLLVRSAFNHSNPKVQVQQFDFDKPDASLVVGDELFCCLGTTIKKAGSKDNFVKVDYDYVTSISKIALHNGIKKIAVVSAMGANQHSSVFYNQTKGKMEVALKNIGFDVCVIVRPSLLLGNRTEFRFGEQIGKYAMLAFSFLIPLKYKAINAHQVAKAMIVKLNSAITGFTVVENDDLLSV